MKFYERNVGDWALATLHLTLLENGVYDRLVSRYYSDERPLPADHQQVCRMIGARTRIERRAVDSVLAEYFELADDGYHQRRCDRVIAEYVAWQEKQDKVKAAERERQQRFYDDRSEIFAGLRAKGVDLAWNTPQPEIRALAKQHGVVLQRVAAEMARMAAEAAAAQSSDTSNAPQTPPEHFSTEPQTAKPLPTTHQPSTISLSTQTEVSREAEGETNSVLTKKQGKPPAVAAVLPSLTEAGRVCQLLRTAGVENTNPGRGELLTLISAGVSDQQWIEAAAKSLGKVDRFAYTLTCASNALEVVAPAASAAARDGTDEVRRVSEDLAAAQAAARSPSGIAARKAAMARFGSPAA